MKQVLKSLKHNGIYIPHYESKGFTIKNSRGKHKTDLQERADGSCLDKEKAVGSFASRQSLYEKLHERIS